MDTNIVYWQYEHRLPTDGYFVGVTRTYSRNPERLLVRLGVRQPYASRLVERAAHRCDDMIVFLIEPGTIHLLHQIDSFWWAKVYDVDVIYQTEDDADTAADLVLKRFSKRFSISTGQTLCRASMLYSVLHAAPHLVPGMSTVDFPALQAATREAEQAKLLGNIH